MFLCIVNIFAKIMRKCLSSNIYKFMKSTLNNEKLSILLIHFRFIVKYELRKIISFIMKKGPRKTIFISNIVIISIYINI